jgi:hypothetical protein
MSCSIGQKNKDRHNWHFGNEILALAALTNENNNSFLAYCKVILYFEASGYVFDSLKRKKNQDC